MKKNIYLKIISLAIVIICVFSVKVFATETENTPPELIEEVNINYDNYYKYNEEIHSKKGYVRKDYNNDSNQLSLVEYIIQESKKCPEYIDISAYKVPWEKMEETFIPMLYEDELFYINLISNWKGAYVNYDPYTGNYDGIIGDKIYFGYTMTPEEIENALKTINSEVARYKRGIKSEWSDLEKILYTNDFLCHTCEYASNIIDTSHTLYGALVEKKPVCDGYSHAFRYLLKQIGMNAEIATSNSMNHAWNLVQINGEYYHIDVTWNDSYNNGVKGVGKTSYEFFLASDTSFQNERSQSHSNWVSDVEATSTKYDGMQEWRKVTSYLIYKDNYWYYVDSTQQSYNAILTKLNLRSDSVEKTIVKENNTNDYIFMQSGFTTDGTNLYYSTRYKIFKMDYNGENLVEFFEVPEKDKCIYSLEIINDVFYYDYLDEVKNGNSTSVSSSSRKTAICGGYEPEEILVYTNIETSQLDDKEIMQLKAKQNISDLLVEENFPIIDKNYVVEIYNSQNNIKSENEKAGSKNIIKIKDTDGVVVAEYMVIVKGDVTGNGYSRMYDAFQILKDSLFNGNLDEIDMLIRDYDGNGHVRMYDAFQFLKDSLFN